MLIAGKYHLPLMAKRKKAVNYKNIPTEVSAKDVLNVANDFVKLSAATSIVNVVGSKILK